jgi:hypothetical protein
MKFSSFLDIKNKKTIKELEVLKDTLSKHFKIDAFLERENPYIFLRANKSDEDLNFEGVRIYKIGSSMAYRIQNENETEPYGQAYPLNLEEMFEELIPDMDDKKAAKVIQDCLIDEFTNFFKKSSEIQKELRSGQFNKNDISAPVVVTGSNSGDYTNSI